MSTTERPILFNGEMIRAILNGRKTQTRRVMRNDPVFLEYNNSWAYAASKCPFGKIGDRLWVRETWGFDQILYDDFPGVKIKYRADNRVSGWHRLAHKIFNKYRAQRDAGNAYLWRPSIHMPRWASRITLEVTDVRVQRLLEISDEDAMAEGCAWTGEQGIYGDGCVSPTMNFFDLWDSINAPRAHGCHTNPWVWAMAFKVVQP